MRQVLMHKEVTLHQALKRCELLLLRIGTEPDLQQDGLVSIVCLPR